MGSSTVAAIAHPDQQIASRPPGSRGRPATGRRTGAGEHQPALDGVRALAIAGVLALHSSVWGDVPAVMPGGNLGVTVFFVLSGYLITGRLLSEHERRGGIDLRAFYLRRAARLLPALVVLLPIYTLIFSGTLSTGRLLLTVSATLLYLSSIVQSVWGAMGNLGWSWSLSVEEYFYALWPLLLRRLLGHRASAGSGRARRWAARDPLAAAIGIAVAAAALATILRVVLTGSSYWNDFAYYSPLTRIDALALGCLVALLEVRRPLPLPRGAGWLALAAIAWCYQERSFAIGGSALDVYGLSFSALAAAVLILDLVRRPRSVLARLLSCRVLGHVGRVSYGLYVWNLLPGQTFHLLAGRHPALAGTLGCAAVVVGLVECSYWFVEQPVLRWARRRLAAGGDGSRQPPQRRRGPRTGEAALARGGSPIPPGVVA
jgi:peptidoglycan/LPS O-acetylase OafA/YrhL